MHDDQKTFLEALLSAVGPSGYEQEPGRIWREEAAKLGAETWTDVHGSSFARINPGGAPRVMIAGHLDEIGFMVTYLDDEGFVFFQPIGGWDSQVTVGQRVWVQTKEGRRTGVIGKKPIHLMDEKDRKKVSRIEDMWIDIGAADGDEARAQVAVGDPVVLAWSPELLGPDKIVSRGLDDRAGAFVALDALRLLSGVVGLAAEVIAVGTAQEEIGLRGATTAAHAIKPQVGFAVDVTFATDHPEMKKEMKKNGKVDIGKGPVVSRGPNINPVLFERIIAAGEAAGLPLQIDPAPRGTPTDANAIQLSRGGVATSLISIANRYMHSPCELCSLSDLDNAARLIAETVRRLDADTDLRVA